MLYFENTLVKKYMMARDWFNENSHVDLKLRLIGKRDQDSQTYNLPNTSEVTALIVGDIGDSLDKRDIIFKTRSGNL